MVDMQGCQLTPFFCYTGVGGGEGAFIMVTFWLVEAMARVGCNHPVT